MITCRLSLRWQKTVKESNRFHVKSLQTVPAKALLFGEYGLLKGGAAAVVLLPNFKFRVQFSIGHDDFIERNCTLRSDFLSRDVTLNDNSLRFGDSSKLTGEQRNLYCYLSQHQCALADSSLLAEIIESYSPAYGFGSSSAILTAFHLFFESLTSSAALEFTQLSREFWRKVYASLRLLQGRGSGYDVASQVYGALLGAVHEPLFLSFNNQGQTIENGIYEFLPEVSRLRISHDELKRFGCFIETGIHSDTRAVLKSAHIQNLDRAFFDSQKFFASTFVKDPSYTTAAELCLAASQVAIKYGLLPQSPALKRFTKMCTQARLPWKTMGAGYGDCLWVMATRDELNELLKEPGVSGLNIRFAFEDV